MCCMLGEGVLVEGRVKLVLYYGDRVGNKGKRYSIFVIYDYILYVGVMLCWF